MSDTFFRKFLTSCGVASPSVQKSCLLYALVCWEGSSRYDAAVDMILSSRSRFWKTLLEDLDTTSYRCAITLHLTVPDLCLEHASRA